MPRTARSIEAGAIYHVLNRGNGRLRLFRKPGDFAAFELVMAQGLERYPVDLLTYCLMGNHWHLVLRPRTSESLGRLMGWIGVTHVRRHHEHYRLVGGGHLYQGRFKSFVVQNDLHLLRVCRYVEANAARAGLVKRAERWAYGGSFARVAGGKPFSLSDWPVDRPPDWLALINQQQDDLKTLRISVNRGRPFGDPAWVQKTVKRLGLEYTMRDRGRPKASNE